MPKKVAKTSPGAKKAPAKKAGAVKALSFDTAALVKRLLAEVPERAREVLVFRFGLGSSAERETLEAIGERWGITRERVRQIEAAGIDAIRTSKAFDDSVAAFDELCGFVRNMGSIVHEDDLLGALAADEKSRNRIRFLLVVGSSFIRERETEHFYARWHVDPGTAEMVHEALTRLYSTLSDDEVLEESEMIERFLEGRTGLEALVVPF